MKDRSYGQIEEPFLFVERACPLVPKNRMALFLEEIEKALALIIDPGLDIRELKTAFLVTLVDFLKGNLCQEESPNHFQDLAVPNTVDLWFHAFPLSPNITSLSGFVKSPTGPKGQRSKV